MPEIKRVNYFTSQFLKEEEFKDEQSYHIAMRRLHNRSLHTWGVVDGLVVTLVAGQKSVTVSPGIAIDSKGREIVLPSDPVPEPIDLSAVTKGTDVLITIAYRDVEDPADKYTTAGVEGKFKRTTERPLVASEASPPADGSVVILARVSVDATGNVGAPNNAVRRLASAVVAPDLEVRSLKWGNNSRLLTDQGGSIELGGDPNTAGVGTPYIDFHFLGKTEDFNARIINDGDGMLTLRVPVFRIAANVGVGATAPGAKLTVQQGPTAAGAAANGKGLFVSALMGTGAAADGGIEFRHDNLTQGIGFGYNTIYATGSNANQDLTIQSRGTGSVLLNPSQGNVGIGSPSPPKAKLQVSGGAIMPAIGNNEQSGIQFPPDPGVGAGDRAFIRYYVESGTETTKLMIGVANDADDAIGFTQFNAERMTIYNGNVGIGTTTPQRRLQVGGDVNGLGFDLSDGSPNAAYVRFGDNTGWKLHFARSREGSAAALNSGQAGILMTLQDNGNVGIGTQSPLTQLHIRKDVVNALGPSITLMNGLGGAGAGASIDFDGYDSAANPPTLRLQSIDDGQGSSHLAISTKKPGAQNNALEERMRITSAGNVGIGTTTPGEDLEVNGRIKSGGLTIGPWPANGLYMFFGANALDQSVNGNYALLQQASTGVTFLNSPENIRFRIGNADKMLLTKEGNFGIGTTTPDSKLDVAGAISAGNSDIYFTKIDHNHTGKGNGVGFAAIENGASHACLMILGRNVGTADKVDRRVKMWDQVDIAGNLGTHGFGFAAKKATWGGGIHTWDVEAEGTIWSNNGVVGNPHDLAENYLSDTDLAPGDVVCLDPERDRIVQSEKPNDLLLIGVVSTAPGVLLNGMHGEEDSVPGMLPYPVALCGRVPCKVTDENGPIHRGDPLTSSSTPGHAMKASAVKVDGIDVYRPGTVIGKALEAHKSGKGLIEVFVALR